MDEKNAREFVESIWEESILPAISDYIRIPNQSPIFDPGWKEAGHMDRAVKLAVDWVKSRNIPDLKIDVVRENGRTPLVLLEKPGKADGTVLLYGHLDKQPPFEGWRQDLGPWKPVREGDRLYGRGGADDGYAIFAITAAMELLDQQGIDHPRMIGVIECCEESGSVDLPFYIESCADRIGSPDLVVCLDSGAGDYDRLWNTTSLRGMVGGDLVIDVLREGVHSGDASGVVASSFRVLRVLLERLEEANSGTIRPEDFHVEIPEIRVQQAEVTAKLLGETVWSQYPFVDGMAPVIDDPVQLILNRTWRPMLAVTAAAGMPPLEAGGNVLRPGTAVKLSLRLPPGRDGKEATVIMKSLLEAEPPYGSRVAFRPEKSASGWNAPHPADWLTKAVDESSKTYFGAEPGHTGEGGSIPFMSMLGRRFPKAQFLVTGVLGPQSNAHGPNEFLHIPTAKALTACVAQVLESFEPS